MLVARGQVDGGVAVTGRGADVMPLVVGCGSVLVEGGEVHRLVLGAGLNGLGVTLDGQLIPAAFEILVASILGDDCLLKRICWHFLHNVLDRYLEHHIHNWSILYSKLSLLTSSTFFSKFERTLIEYHRFAILLKSLFRLKSQAEKSSIKIDNLFLVASAKSAGQKLTFNKNSVVSYDSSIAGESCPTPALRIKISIPP